MFRFDRERLKQAPGGGFKLELPVRFQDVDAAGIIFYPRALELCHDAYVAFLEQAGLPLHEVLRGPWLAPVRHAEADYLKPLRFGDRVEVSLVAAHLETMPNPTEVTLGFRIARVSDHEVAILSQTIHTFVERKTFARTAVPDELRKALFPVTM
jgi:YbgC/YbaW family acyl-CoA thioester hydrolase